MRNTVAFQTFGIRNKEPTQNRQEIMRQERDFIEKFLASKKIIWGKEDITKLGSAFLKD